MQGVQLEDTQEVQLNGNLEVLYGKAKADVIQEVLIGKFRDTKFLKVQRKHPLYCLSASL